MDEGRGNGFSVESADGMYGDVYLNSEKKDRRHFGKIFGIVAICIVLVAVIVLLIVWLTSVVTNNDAEGLLERYGVVLSGWDEYSESSTFELRAAYDDFLESASKDSRYSSIQKILDGYDTALRVVEMAIPLRKISDDFVLEKYLSDGYEKTAAYLDDLCDVAGMPDEASDYVKDIKSYYETLLFVYKIYDENGCIDGGLIESICALNAETMVEGLVDKIKVTYNAKMEADDFIIGVSAVVRDSFITIREIMNDE